MLDKLRANHNFFDNSPPTHLTPFLCVFEYFDKNYAAKGKC